MNPKGKEIYMYILGAVVVLICFAIMIMLIIKPVPVESKDAVMLGLGTLFGMAVTVVGYFFGSSKSSSDKDKVLGDKLASQTSEISEKVNQ